MSISWWTIALQAINFLVLVWLLQRFLYKPALAVMARRKHQVEEAFERAEQARTKAEAEQQAFETRQAELDQSRQALLTRAHAEIAADREKVLAEARSRADSLLDETRQQLDLERKAALAELKGQVGELAGAMAARLLQQLASEPGSATPLTELALARLNAHLDALPEDERRALADDLTASSEALRVTTAIELDAAARERWQQALSERLGHTHAPDFDTDPALIGGVTVRFPHAVLSLAWSEQLERGRAAMLTDDVAH